VRCGGVEQATPGNQKEKGGKGGGGGTKRTRKNRWFKMKQRNKMGTGRTGVGAVRVARKGSGGKKHRKTIGGKEKCRLFHTGKRGERPRKRVCGVKKKRASSRGSSKKRA